MKKIVVAILLILPVVGWCQYESPTAYMGYLNQQDEAIAKDFLAYQSAVAHSHSGRKMERKRGELLKTAGQVHSTIAHMKAYKGDSKLRDAFVQYYSILESILKEDYGKIVNMEEIAEQSYDNMEAYLLAQEKAQEKLQEAAANRSAAYKEFAASQNVRLVDGGEDKTSRKMEQYKQVSDYYTRLYLIYFKSTKQEYYLVEASNASNLNAIEQNKSTLIKYSEEGLAKLQNIVGFESDISVKSACQKLLSFYQTEADKSVPKLTEFLVKNQEFEKVKKVYEGKPAGDRTQQDVDAYNNAVADINKASQAYNQVNKEMNATRAERLQQWNEAVRKFLDYHSPK